MSRLEWTETDERITWRKWAGWKHNLDDPEILPFHLRDATRDQPAPSAFPHFERARTAKHVAPDPDDEEPSPVLVVARQWRRTTPLQALVLVGMALGVVTVGIIAVRSLMGAS